MAVALVLVPVTNTVAPAKDGVVASLANCNAPEAAVSRPISMNFPSERFIRRMVSPFFGIRSALIKAELIGFGDLYPLVLAATLDGDNFTYFGVLNIRNGEQAGVGHGLYTGMQGLRSGFCPSPRQ